MSEVKKGDRVRFTVEGEVTCVAGDGSCFDMGKYCYSTDRGTVEIIEKPLAVGDIVTEENVQGLPLGKYILADKDGDSWETFPAASISRDDYGPFTLVYIHGASDEGK